MSFINWLLVPRLQIKWISLRVSIALDTLAGFVQFYQGFMTGRIEGFLSWLKHLEANQM